jgi:hypothetical protein
MQVIYSVTLISCVFFSFFPPSAVYDDPLNIRSFSGLARALAASSPPLGVRGGPRLGLSAPASAASSPPRANAGGVSAGAWSPQLARHAAGRATASARGASPERHELLQLPGSR